MAVKPCCTCGSPVADTALGRGAVETADGRRYCSPCAARLQRELTPEADAVRSVSAPPAAAGPAAPERAAAPETARSAARPPAPVRPRARAKPTTRVKPPSRPASATARVKPRRPSSRLARAGSRAERRAADASEASGSKTSQLTSRRVSRVDLPWYFRLSRAQIAGIAAVAGALVLLLIVGAAASSCSTRPNRREHIVKNPVPYYGAPGPMMDRAGQLVAQGKIDEALRVLEEAKSIAQKNGQDRLVVEINQKIHGLRFKTVH
jgi:hypothetical protein